jgi:hypothetical protein
MSSSELSPTQEQAMTELVQGVARALASGQSRQQVAGTLVSNGWDQADADVFVGRVHQQAKTNRRAQASDDGSGFAIWIGLLLVINFLSWVFNWPFWIY